MSETLISIYKTAIEDLISSNINQNLSHRQLFLLYSVYRDIFDALDLGTFRCTVSDVRYLEHKLLSFAKGINTDEIYLRSPAELEDFNTFYLQSDEDIFTCKNKLILLLQCLSQDCSTLLRYKRVLENEHNRLQKIYQTSKNDTGTYLLNECANYEEEEYEGINADEENLPENHIDLNDLYSHVSLEDMNERYNEIPLTGYELF